jgi:DNA transformation protein
MAGDRFHDFVKELFAGMGPIQVKRMFGGAGVYAEGLMFGLLADDAIHIRAKDDAMQRELRAEGSGPFIWTPQSGPHKGEHIDLGYWRLPDSALDDPDEAAKWGRKALALAKAKAAAKPARKKAPKPKAVKKATPKRAKR